MAFVAYTPRAVSPLALVFALAGLLVSLAAPAGAALAGEAPAGRGDLPLATFENDTPGQPPVGWKARGGDIEDVYVIREESGRKYLHADARGTSIQIGKDQSYDVKKFPILTWRWRVTVLPEGGDERKKEAGDSAAGVYVVFGGWPVPRTIKYVWSSTLPPETRTESPFAGQTKIVVLRSGEAEAGQWVEERVNVLEDYRQFFGEDPNEARGVAILSDADNTKSRAVADYDAIVANPPADAAPLLGQSAAGRRALAYRARAISAGEPGPGSPASPQGAPAPGLSDGPPGNG